jgi:hypothetical protein
MERGKEMKSSIRRLKSVFVFSVSLCLCGSTGSVRADPKKPTFDDDVLPILKQSCVNCHGNDKQKGGLNLATFAAAMQGGSSGAVVAPRDPDKSRLFTLSSHKEEPKMPPNSAKIDQAKLDTLRLWIEQGARENAGSKASAPPKPKTDIGLKSVVKGRPEGPPPMPQAGKYRLDPVVRARRPGAVVALAASPWAPLVAVGGQKQVVLYHADTGDLLGVLPFEHGQINSLKFSRNAKLLLAAGGRGGQSGKAVLFNVETGEKVIEVGIETDAILAADISADQTQIAVGSPSKLVRIYSTQDGSVVREIKKHTDWVTAVEFSPDGVLLATGDRNGGLFVWESFTGREYFSLRGHTAMITDVSWRDDSNALASASLDTTIKLWEMENGGNIKNWGAHGAGVEAVKFTHDGKIASTGRDRVTKLWDENGAVQKQFEAFPDLGLRVAATHDNTKVFAGDWSGQLKGWDVADAKAVAVLDGNPPPAGERFIAAQAAVTTAEAKLKLVSDALAAAQANAKKANDACAAAQANAAKVAAELTAAQKAVTDRTAAVTAATPQVAPAKTEVDKLTPVSAAAQAKAAALEATAPVYAEAAKKIADAAAKAPQNAELAAAAKTAATTAQQQADALAAAKKAAGDAAAALKVATDKYAALAKAVTEHQAAAAEAQKKATTIQPMVKPAQDAVAPAKTAADAANAAAVAAQAKVAAATVELTAAKARVERLKPAAATQQVSLPAKK